MGTTAINYQATPFTGTRPAQATTPQLLAFAGDPVQIHVLAPWSEQAHVFSIENHRWPQEPGEAGSDRIDAVHVGGLEAITLHLEEGAGGAEHLPGEYEYGDHRQPYREAGMWGVLRVACPGDIPLRHLHGASSDRPCRPSADRAWTGPLSFAALLSGLLVLAVAARQWVRSRKRLEPAVLPGA
jgi:hypothetical protein